MSLSKSKIVIFLSLGFIARASVLASGMIVAKWADFLSSAPSTHINSKLSNHSYWLWFAGLVSVGLILTTVFRVLVSKYAINIVGDLHDRILKLLGNASKSFFDKTPKGHILNVVGTEYATLLRFAGGSTGEILSLIIDLILIFIFLVFIQPLHIISLSLISLLGFFLYQRHKKNLADSRQSISTARSLLLSRFEENIDSKLSFLTSPKARMYLNQRFEADELRFFSQKKVAQKEMSKFGWYIGILNACALIFAGLCGFYLIVKFKENIGIIVSSTTYLLLYSSSLQAFLEIVARFEEAKHSLYSISTFENQKKDVNLNPKEVAIKKILQIHKSRLSLENVNFSYSDGSKNVLSNISFSLDDGENIGIIGRSGCGKSTLFQVLLGLYPIKSGEIFVENPKDLSLNFAYIPQKASILKGSLRENLVGASKQHDDEIREILSELWLLSIFKDKLYTSSNDRIQDPLDFEIENEGLNLSAGERQLLSTARALLLGERILIMDEPTSEMDKESEENFLRTMDIVLKHRTQIRIAHHLKTVKNCDRIVWMEKGAIRMIGPPCMVFPLYNKDH